MIQEPYTEWPAPETILSNGRDLKESIAGRAAPYIPRVFATDPKLRRAFLDGYARGILPPPQADRRTDP